MAHGTYVGESRPELKGQRAIILPVREGVVRLQFDDLSLGLKLTHAWTEFNQNEVEYDPKEE